MLLPRRRGLSNQIGKSAVKDIPIPVFASRPEKSDIGRTEQ